MDLPIPAVYGQTTVINETVYFGGFDADKDDDEHKIYSYHSFQDVWTTLPPLPVRWFGLGQVRGKLVAVGGGMVCHIYIVVVYALPIIMLRVFDKKSKH